MVPGDDEDSLRVRIQATERVLYLQAIRDLCSGLISTPDSTGQPPYGPTTQPQNEVCP